MKRDLKTLLQKVINEYGKKFNLLKDGEKSLGDDVREGLTAIISVKLTECEFEGQTKGRLGNPEVKGFIEKMIMEKLMCYLEENPADAKAIFEKSLAAAAVPEKRQKKPEKLQEEKLPWKALRFRVSLQTVQSMTLNLQKYISSREILREVLQKRAETGGIRLYFLYGVRC